MSFLGVNFCTEKHVSVSNFLLITLSNFVLKMARLMNKEQTRVDPFWRNGGAETTIKSEYHSFSLAVASLFAIWAADKSFDYRNSGFGCRHLDLLTLVTDVDPAAEFRVVNCGMLVFVVHCASIT